MCAAIVELGCDQAASAKEGKPDGPAPSPVAVSELREQPFIERRVFFGQVSAVSDASLSPAESGRVTRVHVVEGQSVERGDLLVELDDRLARVELDEALAQKKQTLAEKQQAQLEAKRFSLMQEAQIVSELEATRRISEADSLSAQAESSEARIALGAERVQRHRIFAPFDGIVTRRLVDPGDWLNSGDIALSMLTAGHVEVAVRVSAKMLDQVDRVAEVLLVRDGAWREEGAALGGAKAPAPEEAADGRRSATQVRGRIDSVVDALDPQTRTALFRVTPEGEPPSWLRAGATVDVVFFLERRDGLAIPRDALVYGVAGQRVVVVEEGKARPVPVEVIAQSQELSLVRSTELSLGAQLVIRGNERLRPGQPVTTEGALLPPHVGASRENAPSSEESEARASGGGGE